MRSSSTAKTVAPNPSSCAGSAHAALAKRFLTPIKTRAWLWLSLSLAAAAPAYSEPAPIRIEIQGTDTLPRSAHASVPLLVELANGASAPLLLTPRIEGSAVELVRGRLLRADARVLDATHLRFELPVVARSEGTAILRVEVTTYLCTTRCRRVLASESRVLHVR